MKKYIERETLLQIVKKHQGNVFGIPLIVTEIENAPAEDVREVVHGHWFLLDECSNAGVYCSVCHKKVYKEHYANVKVKSKFCPNCGAMMDGEFEKL